MGPLRMEFVMDKTSTTPIETPHAIPQAIMTFWELPIEVSAALWKAGLAIFWLQAPHLHHHFYRDKDDQLVVPEPIEEEGEHALFA